MPEGKNPDITDASFRFHAYIRIRFYFTSTHIFIFRLSAKGTDGVMKPILGFRSSDFPDILSL